MTPSRLSVKPCSKPQVMPRTCHYWLSSNTRWLCCVCRDHHQCAELFMELDAAVFNAVFSCLKSQWFGWEYYQCYSSYKMKHVVCQRWINYPAINKNLTSDSMSLYTAVPMEECFITNLLFSCLFNFDCSISWSSVSWCVRQSTPSVGLSWITTINSHKKSTA